MKPRYIVDILDKYRGSAVGGALPAGVELASIAHWALLVEWSPTVKLVGSLNESEMAESLYLDSLIAAAFLAKSFEGCRVVHDIGSGAGFPALFLPWYCSAETRFVLHEARRRKASFLRAAAREMGATNVLVENDRVSSGSLLADAVLSRATFPPETWLALAGTLLSIGGRAAVFLAGERFLKPSHLEMTGMMEIAVHQYALPQSGRRRAIAVYEKRP